MMLGKRGALRVLSFFCILVIASPGLLWGAGFSLPLGEPRTTCRILRQVVRGTGMRTKKKMCAIIGTHDEKRQKTT